MKFLLFDNYNLPTSHKYLSDTVHAAPSPLHSPLLTTTSAGSIASGILSIL